MALGALMRTDCSHSYASTPTPLLAPTLEHLSVGAPHTLLRSPANGSRVLCKKPTPACSSARACAVADHVLANGWSLLLSVETVRSMKIPYWTPSLPYKLLLALRLLSLALYARSQRLHLHNPSPPR
jgi:hypothetical protein